MPYTHFQFVAYQVPTIRNRQSGDRLSTMSIPAGQSCDAVDDMPVPEDLGLCEDALKRLRRLAAVVDTARRTKAVEPNEDDILKIFVAPEFYFRPESDENYYSYSYEQYVNILTSLSLMFRLSPRLRDWLIIPGTILAHEVAPSRLKYFYNTAAVIRGYAEDLVSLIEKRQPSNLDGVPIAGGVANPDFEGGSYRPEYSDWDMQQRRIFTTDGIQFALDICLDHLGPMAFMDNTTGIPVIQDNLRQAKQASFRVNRERGTHTFLHILTAGGMPISDLSVAAFDGYILRTDGSPDQPIHTELKSVDSYTRHTARGNYPTNSYDMAKGDPIFNRTTNQYEFPNSARADLRDIAHIQTIPLTGKLRIPNPVDMPQSIVIYPGQLLN